MAQPPAVIVKTRKPAGEWQLHQLARRTQFYCTRCEKYVRHDFVATRNGDWAQTVCPRCYDYLTRALRRQKKTDADTSKVWRLLPGIDGLLAFFRTAGIDAAVMPGGILAINGRPTRTLGHLPSPETQEWKLIVDELALQYAGGLFIKAIEDNARFGEGLRALLRQREKGFAIMRGDVRLAIIHATRAEVSDHDIVYANFLMPGPHWKQVSDAIQDAEAEPSAVQDREPDAAVPDWDAAANGEGRQATARRRLDRLPGSLAPELITVCLDASRRIRQERQVAYDRPVILLCAAGDLTLLPVTGSVTRLRMPFRLSSGTTTLNGELLLEDRDPLPLLIDASTADDDALATAWAYALRGFADATCIDLHADWPPPPGSTRPIPRLPVPVSPRAPAQILPRRRPWSAHLDPVGHWTRYSGSLVAGHRRRLTEDKTASAEAHERARQVGITLGAGETWVRPHARGIPDGTEIRFLWHTPAEFELLHLA
jgi:hypothetical protein